MTATIRPPAPTPRPTAPIVGSDARFAVRRIFCVGRNYRAHAVEMGASPEEPPFFFAKAADALLVCDPEGTLAYPPRTEDLQHEVELVVAVGREGRDVAPGDALDHVFGYAVGLDMTRRDVQRDAKAARRPWAVSKDFDGAAPMGPIHAAGRLGHPRVGAIRLSVDGVLRQDADLSHMSWDVPSVLAELSRWTALQPGDLVFTGTPSGVGAVVPGNVLVAEIDGLSPMTLRID